MSFLNDILEYYADQEPDSLATQGQLDYIRFLLDWRTSPPKQVEQHVAAMMEGLTFEQAQTLIELLKTFELDPGPSSATDINKAVEDRVAREP
jgi:hypothetical protein